MLYPLATFDRCRGCRESQLSRNSGLIFTVATGHKLLMSACARMAVSLRGIQRARTASAPNDYICTVERFVLHPQFERRRMELPRAGKKNALRQKVDSRIRDKREPTSPSQARLPADELVHEFRRSLPAHPTGGKTVTIPSPKSSRAAGPSAHWPATPSTFSSRCWG